MSGPLAGIRIVELAGIGPGPYTCMLLADAGADVSGSTGPPGSPPAADGPALGPAQPQSRRSVAVDLKHPEGVALVLDLVAQADGLVEGWRPGVAERLGIGPEPCLARNPRLVYGRMTGWGQEGPLASAAGHDINYIALAGALWPIGRAGERPVPPLNLVGDFGGGGMVLAFGMCRGLARGAAFGAGPGRRRRHGGRGGLAHDHDLSPSANLACGREDRGVNMLDTGAPFYEVYETA